MRAMIPFLLAGSMAVAASDQVPQPFPKPGQRPPPGSPPNPQQPVQTPAPAQTIGQDQNAPPESALPAPVYPAAQFITSYDAGKGQRYYLYGAMAPYGEVVQYYRSVLRQRGDEVFEQPPVHQFDLARFREETMAFPPSVTVKDYTWGGRGGYLNPKRGAQPERFPTIIQIVPHPAGSGR